MTTEKNDAALDLINQLDSMLSRDTSQYTLDKAKELAWRIIRIDYWRDVRSVAESIKEAIASGEITDSDEAETMLHESADGSARVTYTAQAMECLMVSDNADAFDDLGEFPMIDGAPNWSGAAYYAFVADIREELSSMDVDFSAIGEEEESDDEDAEPEEASPSA